MTRRIPLHLTTAIAAVLIVSTSQPALAQISPANQIIGCQSIDNDIARLECFDLVAARLNTMVKPPPAQTLSPVIPKTATTPPDSPVASEPAMPEMTNTYSVAPATAAPTKAEAAIKDFGKDLKAPPKPKEAALLTPKGDVIFTVKHVQIFDFVKKRFYMTNGQVWEQTTAANLDIDEGKPPAGTTAEISKGGFGGYKLKINDKKWGVKVKRVR